MCVLVCMRNGWRCMKFRKSTDIVRMFFFDMWWVILCVFGILNGICFNCLSKLLCLCGLVNRLFLFTCLSSFASTKEILCRSILSNRFFVMELCSLKFLFVYVGGCLVIGYVLCGVWVRICSKFFMCIMGWSVINSLFMISFIRSLFLVGLVSLGFFKNGVLWILMCVL